MVDEPVDVLELELIVEQADGLAAKDTNMFGIRTSSDPYVAVNLYPRDASQCQEPHYLGKTHVVMQSLSPVWGLPFNITVPRAHFTDDAHFELTLFDWDNYTEDDLMGTVKVHIPIRENDIQNRTKWYGIPKSSAGGDEATGRVQCTLSMKRSMKVLNPPNDPVGGEAAELSPTTPKEKAKKSSLFTGISMRKKWNNKPVFGESAVSADNDADADDDDDDDAGGGGDDDDENEQEEDDDEDDYFTANRQEVTAALARRTSQMVGGGGRRDAHHRRRRNDGATSSGGNGRVGRSPRAEAGGGDGQPVRKARSRSINATLRDQAQESGGGDGHPVRRARSSNAKVRERAKSLLLAKDEGTKSTLNDDRQRSRRVRSDMGGSSGHGRERARRVHSDKEEGTGTPKMEKAPRKPPYNDGRPSGSSSSRPHAHLTTSRGSNDDDNHGEKSEKRSSKSHAHRTTSHGSNDDDNHGEKNEKSSSRSHARHTSSRSSNDDGNHGEKSENGTQHHSRPHSSSTASKKERSSSTGGSGHKPKSRSSRSSVAHVKVNY